MARTSSRLRFASARRGVEGRGSSEGRGFTLIEIMVVVAIMGLILAAGIPSLYGFFHKEGLRKSMSDLEDTCEAARDAAIMSGQPAELVIHPKNGTLEVEGGNGKWGGQVHSAKLEGVHIEALKIDNTDRDFSQAETVKVKFYPKGTCDEMIMVLQTDKNEMKGVTLEITTGLAVPLTERDIMALGQRR